MVLLPCLAVSLMMRLVAVVFVLSALLLILIVLIQKGRGGGLSAAFGGGGAGGILGSKTGDFLTWVTIVAACVFLLLAMVMAKYYRPAAADLENADAAAQNMPAETDTGAPVVADGNDAAVLPTEPIAPADANTLNGVVETVIEEANQAATEARGAVDTTLPVGVGQ